ncbi:hypothetical protein DEO72_LG7g753 [Vigna unguiculata]|uniref:Uncharacterized protein n=1 Tax=Vigna unguiculata TaxID=3917 RepID=A0A4D6MG53_VIGUN|nr:hypothetical protein DEO72_LG7g753 [Vigna unguiculata]
MSTLEWGGAVTLEFGGISALDRGCVADLGYLVEGYLKRGVWWLLRTVFWGGVFGQCMQAGMTGWATGYKAWSWHDFGWGAGHKAWGKRPQVWSKRPSGFAGDRVLGRVLSQCLQVGMTLVGELVTRLGVGMTLVGELVTRLGVGMTLVGELVTRLGVSGPRFGVSGHQASLGTVY